MLHARRYQEEALAKKQQQPTIEIKDSGYTTNNTVVLIQNLIKRMSFSAFYNNRNNRKEKKFVCNSSQSFSSFSWPWI